MLVVGAGIALVTLLYDQGVLPIAGPFALLFLLPILIPLRRRGLRRRLKRLTHRLGEPLDALGPAIDQERSLAPHARGSKASDETLSSAAAQVASARAQLAAGDEEPAARTVVDLARAAEAYWSRRAPVTTALSHAAGTAHTLSRLQR